MSIVPEYFIERKMYKAQISRWKIFFFIALSIIIFLIGKNYFITANDYIASISISGKIPDNVEDIKSKLDHVRMNDKIKALIVSIDTGGGSVTGSEILYNSLNKITKKKPVVVVMGSVCASGGYLISLASNYIFCHNSTITGSIGVVKFDYEITELMKKLGITTHILKTGKYKCNSNPFEKFTEENINSNMTILDDIYDFFTSIVSKKRNLPIDVVKNIANGAVYTGRQALVLKLVDAIGDEHDAKIWLNNVMGIDKNLLVKSIRYNTSYKNDNILGIIDSVYNFIYRASIILFSKYNM